MKSSKHINISIEELQQSLEPLIRRIIQEELKKMSDKFKNIFYLTPEMPLYEDMKNIAVRKAKNDITLLSHEEVWNE